MEAENTREKIDIKAVNKDIVKVVNDVNRLREKVNGFIEEMEG